MRFFLVILIWIVLVGGLRFYIQQRDAALPPAATAPRAAVAADGANIAIELTPTFSTEQDPFALQVGEQETAPLQLYLNGSELSLPRTDISRGTPLLVKNLENVRLGSNEIRVTASPPVAEARLEHGIRVKVFAGDGTLLVDRTLWAGGGSLVSGNLEFHYDTKQNHGH